MRFLTTLSWMTFAAILGWTQGWTKGNVGTEVPAFVCELESDQLDLYDYEGRLYRVTVASTKERAENGAGSTCGEQGGWKSCKFDVVRVEAQDGSPEIPTGNLQAGLKECELRGCAATKGSGILTLDHSGTLEYLCVY